MNLDYLVLVLVIVQMETQLLDRLVLFLFGDRATL